MSARRKPSRKLASILAVPVIAVLSLGAAGAQSTPAAHSMPAHLTAVQAPAPLDAMNVMAVTRLASQRAEEAREERAEARAQARRQREAVLLAARQRVLAVQAARAHAAAVAVRAVTPAVSYAGVYSYAGVEALWRAAGGDPAYASTAACIAMHEPGGRANAVSPTYDFGVFQEHADPAALNPQVSAVTAVRMSSNGTNWSAWTTAGYC